MTESVMKHFAHEVTDITDLHAVILRTCVITPKNKKAYTVMHNFFSCSYYLLSSSNLELLSI